MKTGQLLIGAMVGITAGAIIGILYAPKKGSVTRRFIAQKGNDYMDDMKERFNDNLKIVNQKIDSLKDEVKTLVKKGLLKAEEELKNTSV
jgi:gas vesicle protein